MIEEIFNLKTNVPSSQQPIAMLEINRPADKNEKDEFVRCTPIGAIWRWPDGRPLASLNTITFRLLNRNGDNLYVDSDGNNVVSSTTEYDNVQIAVSTDRYNMSFQYGDSVNVVGNMYYGENQDYPPADESTRFSSGASFVGTGCYINAHNLVIPVDHNRIINHRKQCSYVLRITTIED